MPAEPLRVLINACTMPTDATGIGVYAYELAAALASAGECHVTFVTPGACPPGAHQSRPPTTIEARPRWWSAAHLQVWTQLAIPSQMRRNRVDIYHGSEFSVPVISRMPTVSTIHDLAFRHIPRNFDGARKRLYFRLMAETARRANAIIVPSAHVASEVMREFGVPATRIHVTPLAARASMQPAAAEAVVAAKQQLGLDRPYLLCVGIWNRNKRVVDAIRATALLRDSGVDIELVLAGNAAPHVMPRYLREVERLGLSGRVHFLGHVLDADLPALYTGATALAFPSEYEGFGLPPLEAMACGTPVIVSSFPAVQEQCHGAAMTVPPRTPAAVAECVRQLVVSSDAREEWIGHGLQRAAEYSWKRTAAATLEVYRQLV